MNLGLKTLYNKFMIEWCKHHLKTKFDSSLKSKNSSHCDLARLHLLHKTYSLTGCTTECMYRHSTCCTGTYYATSDTKNECVFI